MPNTHRVQGAYIANGGFGVWRQLGDIRHQQTYASCTGMGQSFSSSGSSSGSNPGNANYSWIALYGGPLACTAARIDSWGENDRKQAPFTQGGIKDENTSPT